METVLTLMIISVSTHLLHSTYSIEYCVLHTCTVQVEQPTDQNDIMFVIAKVILSEFLWGIPHIFLNTIYLHSHYVAIIHYDDISYSSGKFSSISWMDY